MKSSTRTNASHRFDILMTSCVIVASLLPATARSQNAESKVTEQQAMANTGRTIDDPEQLKRWIQNMVWYHDYRDEHIAIATGLSVENVKKLRHAMNVSRANIPKPPANSPLLMLPYPGGRHPRIGFLDGALQPQRETKISVFAPWDQSSYVVIDVPEAIWSNLGLTYLAHTHVDTIWSTKNIKLPQLEWQLLDDGSLRLERKLPNGIVFGSRTKAHRDHVQMEMWLTNGTNEKLSDLRVQNCVMLRFAKGFEQQTNDNKVIRESYVACHNESSTRWLITAWEPNHRPWSNPPCPCLHSDPKFSDCDPGETKRLRGWFSFFEGSDINAEIKRIDETGWKAHPFLEVAK
ncbi:MAG: hypothetical protein KDB27_10240 [Planctomycetales bacterium]|nr:hypothetical protein [Planctomycetales bacterium]